MDQPLVVPGTAYHVVLVTVPSAAEGERIGRTLVDERLAACVNIVPGLQSIYRWQGAVETAEEALLVIKTRAARLDALATRIVALHPYSVPEILSIPVEAGLEAYLGWIGAETT